MSTSTQKTNTRRPARQQTNLLRGNFQLFNEKGDLKLFSEPSDRGLKGVVFEKNKKVMDAFPRVKHVTVSADTEMNMLSDTDVQKGRFYDHHEGALVRVYWASETWQVSTQKKIDAFRSRWGSSQSFGDTWSRAVAHLHDENNENVERVQLNQLIPR